MRESTNITSIGLQERDKRILHSILKIISNIHSELNILENENIQEADIVFVNCEDQEAIEQIRATDNGLTPVFLVDANTALTSGISIRRPIVLKRILQAIESICSTRVANKLSRVGANKHQYLYGGQNILVVDDSYPVRKYMEQKIREYSHHHAQVYFAGNGKEAISEIERFKFDVIFLDIVMPDMNGYRICKWIKSVQSNARVILLSGKKSPIDKVRGSMSGCDAFLTKPPSEERLAEVFRQFISMGSPARVTA